jgi:hypothetical protein
LNFFAINYGRKVAVWQVGITCCFGECHDKFSFDGVYKSH